jgi:hypothetical protein
MKTVHAILLFLFAICTTSCGKGNAASQKAKTTWKPNEIPIQASRWYMLNRCNSRLDGLFDGVIKEKVSIHCEKVLENYDAYYPVLDGETIALDSIKFYDGQGTNEWAPLTLYVINSQWQRIPIATFVGSKYNEWVGPNPQATGSGRFKLAQRVTDIKYLVINTSGAYPDEMELYGTYTAPPAIAPAPNKHVQLKQMFGVNAFEWDFENPASPLVIDEARMKAVKNFTAVRHYLDWQQLELHEGSFSFNPSMRGGWNYDAMYARAKAEGIEILADLKTIPEWMQATYPQGERDEENVPLKYGKDYSDPKSYVEQARVAFQFAARYGSNANVLSSLLSVNSIPRWTNDPVNEVKKGLNLVKYIECDNERDKWWKGRKAYQSGREYAANMSAFYDGHKNTMGAGVGVKNADPNMKVVMGGVATTNTDYLMGMIDWCKEFRGYKNGKVDLCWDVINYHIYANDAQNSQSGNSNRGAAPEVSGADIVAKQFIDVAHRFAADMPVWITETGYDVNQGSPLKAIPIGNKNELQTQADWILRTALMCARLGIERIFFYQLYDENLQNPGKFASSGLINADRTRKPAADYMMQANKLMGEYKYMETISNNPLVDRYELNGQSAYVLVKPSENGSSVNYTLNLGTAKSATIYTPTPGKDDMEQKRANTTGGKLSLSVTETPVFVIPSK